MTNSHKIFEDHIMPVSQLTAFIHSLMEMRPVMGPVERKNQPGFYLFDWLESAEDFMPEYTTTVLPPKKAFFPPHQTLFHFTSDLPPEILPGHENFLFS